MPKTYPVPCTKEEIDALLDAAAENEFYYTLFYLAKTTGRRLGEYIGIKKKYKKYSVDLPGVKVKDIDFDNKIMMTIILKRGNRVKKEALLTDEAARILKQFIVHNKLGLEDEVFTKYKRNAIQQAVKRYAKIAAIKHNVTFHNFRHYFVTHLVKEGWSYDKIAKLTGHTTPQTLMHYDHVVASDIKKDAMESLRDI